MKEEDIVVVSSDSEDDEDTVWMRKKQNKQYQILSEKIKSIMYYQVQPGYKKTNRFPYEQFQEFANDFKKSLELVYTNSTKSFIWKNLIRWLVSIKTCFENVSDCINDKCYNLILTDFMAQYVNYKCKLNSSITDEAEVSLITNDIMLTLNLVFNGWVPGILMTLLKVEVIDDYKLILYPIFRKYLSIKHLHRSDDLISYLRLIFCFRKWKKLTHLKEDKEIINEIAVGKSLKALSSDVIDLSTETADIPVLPKIVPAVNEDNRSFAKINGLIGFAIKNRENGTRILLINKTLELDEAIEQFFKLYSEHIHRGALKPELSTADIKPTAIEDLTRSTSPDQLFPGLSCALRDSSESANKSKISYGKQGTKAVDQHLSINCDTSSLSVFNKFNFNSHTIENLSPSFKFNQENRNSEVVLSSNNNSNNNNVLDLDETDDEDDNKPLSEYEKQVVEVIEKLKKRAIIAGELLARANADKTSNAPVVLPISSHETRQSSDEVPIAPAATTAAATATATAASNNVEALIPNPDPDPIRGSLNPPNSLPVEKHIRKRHGIVSSTTSFEGTGDDSDNSDDYDGFGVHSRILFSQRSFYKVVEEATSSTNEIPKTTSNVTSQPRRSISSSPCPTRPSSASPDRWSNFSPSSTIRSGSSSRLGIIPGTSITTGRPVNCINDGELPTCSRYVPMNTTAANLGNQCDKSQEINVTLTNKESETSINVIQSSATAPDKSETDGDKTLPSVPESDQIQPRTDIPVLDKSADLEVNTHTCSVKDLLKNITGFIGDSQEEYGFESSKNKCGPDKSPRDFSETPKTAENPSASDDNGKVEKIIPKPSQIEVKTTLNAVEKNTDTNTEKDVEKQIETSIDQQSNSVLELETINDAKNTKDATNIIKIQRSSPPITIEKISTAEVFKDNCDVEKPSEMPNLSNSNTDKKSSEEKEVAISENQKAQNLPIELDKVENKFKLFNERSKIELMKDASNLKHTETLVEITKNQVKESKSIADQDNLFESVEEDDASLDDIESPPYEPICQSESLDTPHKNSELDNKEEHIVKDECNKISKETIQPVENISAENENCSSVQTVEKDFNISSNSQKDEEENTQNIVEQDSEPSFTIFDSEDIILTNEVAKIEKTTNNKVEEPPKAQNEANTNKLPKRFNDAKLKINEIVKSDHDYVTVEYSDSSQNDLAYDELKELNSFTDSQTAGSIEDLANDFENSTKDTTCSDQEKEEISCEDGNETINDYDQFFQVFTDPAFSTCTSDNQEHPNDTIKNQLPANEEVEDKESSNSISSELTGNCSADENKTTGNQINDDGGVIEEDFFECEKSYDETIENQTITSAKENEDQCFNPESSFGISAPLFDTELNTESELCSILDQNETNNGDTQISPKISESEIQSVEVIEKQSSLSKDKDTSLVEVTPKDDSSPEDDRKDKSTDNQTGDDTETDKDQPTIEQISCEHNITTIDTELVSFDKKESVQQPLNVAKTTDTEEAFDVDVIDENQLPAEQIISDEFVIPIATEATVNNIKTNDEMKDDSKIDRMTTCSAIQKTAEEIIEKRNSYANKTEEDQSVVQNVISDQNTSLIDKESICEKTPTTSNDKDKDNKDNIEELKMCQQIDKNNKTIENQSSLIEDMINECPAINQKGEANEKQTTDIQEMQEIASDDKLAQQQKETTTKGENQLDNNKTEQTEIQEKSSKALDKSLEVLTTIEQEPTLILKVVDDKPLKEDIPKEKSSVLSQPTALENINKSQALLSQSLSNEIDNSSNKRKLKIRIARMPILEDELDRADSLSKTKTSQEPELEEFKSIEDLREHQIPKHTSRKIEKSNRKKIKKALKKKALQKLIFEKVHESIVLPIKDSKTSSAGQFLESVSIHTEHEVKTKEGNTNEEQHAKTEAIIVSENSSEFVVKDVKEVVPEVCDKTKPDKISTKKNKTAKKELRKKKINTNSKPLLEKQSYELNVSKSVDHENEATILKANYDNQSGNNLDSVKEHERQLNIDPVTSQKDHVIQKKMFDDKESKLAPQINPINSPSIAQNETQRAFEDEDQSRTGQTTTEQTANDSQDQGETTMPIDNYLDIKDPREPRKTSTPIEPKVIFSNTIAQERENTMEMTDSEVQHSSTTNVDIKIEENTPCSSKAVNKHPKEVTLGVENSPLFHPKVVDVEQLGSEDILDTTSELSKPQKMNEEVQSCTTDEHKRKLIIRIPKLLVSKEDLPKEEIPSTSKTITAKIQKPLKNEEHCADNAISQETLPEKEVLKKKKMSKKKHKTGKSISTLKSNVLEKDVKEPLIVSISETQDCKLEFSESADIQIKNQTTTIEKDQHKKNKLKVITEIANENLEGVEKTREKKIKAKGSKIQGVFDEIHNLEEHVDETLQAPTEAFKLTPEKQNLNLNASECLTTKFLKPVKIEDDLMICSNKTLRKLKKKNKKSKQNDKPNIPAKTVVLQDTNSKLIATTDSTLSPNAPEISIPNEDHKTAAEDNNVGNEESLKPKPKVTVDNVIGHKSFVKAIMEEYMRKSLNDPSTDIPNVKSLENDEPKLTNLPTGELDERKTDSIPENVIEKQIRKHSMDSKEESPSKKQKTTIEAHSLLKPIEESALSRETPAIEMQNLQMVQVKVETVEDDCLPVVDTASVNSPSKDVKCAECQTEPKSTIVKYVQPCSSKCQTFSDVSSAKQLDPDTLKTIVECKDDLIKNRNQEVFSQITCAKQQNSIEPDSSSQLATELQRTESTLTEEESNLSTRVQVADLDEPTVISDSEISQQNASVALESDKSIVFYPSRDSAEDQEVSSITSQTNDMNEVFYNYHDENGTPVMDEKNLTEEESPSSQCKIISLSKIRVPSADVHEITTLLLSQNTQLTESSPNPHLDITEPELRPASIDNVDKCDARSDESTTQLWDNPDENFELWLKKIGISKNCALKGKHVAKNLTKSFENYSENQKNDRKQKKPRRVQKFEAYQTDQKSFNFEDLNAAAILTSFKARQKKNNRSRKGLQPTRITRSASQMVELAESILQHESEQIIPSISCLKSQFERDPLENLNISGEYSELIQTNGSSDSEDDEKLIIDLNAKKSTKSKVKKKKKPKQVKNEKAVAKKINKTVKKISFNPIVEVFEVSSPDIFERFRGRTRSSKNLLTQSPQVTNTTKTRRGTLRKKSEQIKIENDVFAESTKKSKTPIKRGKLRINFDFPVGNEEESAFTEEQNKDSLTSTSTCTPHNMNQETWLKNLTLRKTSKSLDSEVKQLFENVSKVKKVISEPDLLKAPKIDVRFLQLKTKESENVLETMGYTNKTEEDKNSIKSKSDIPEGKEVVPVATLKVSMKGVEAKTLRTNKQLKGEKLKKCIRRLSMEMDMNDKDKSSQQPKKPTKLIKKSTLCENPLTVAAATPTLETQIVEEPKNSETFSKFVKSIPTKSSLETLKNSEILLESKTVQTPEINKNGKEQKIAKVEEFATLKQAESVAEVSSLSDVEKQTKSISKKANKSTKKRTQTIADLIKSSKQPKKPKLINKEPTPFEDPIAPVTPDNGSVYKTDLMIHKNVKEEKTAKVKGVAAVEQAKSITKVSNAPVEEASLNESTFEEEKQLTEKVEVACSIKSSKQQKKPKTFVKEAKAFVDPIIPAMPHSGSPSKTSKSALTNLTHEPTKHSVSDLSGSALAETKIDKNEKDQQTATIEKAKSITKASNARVEKDILNEVEKQLKPTLKEENKLTEKVEVACSIKSSKQQKKPKTTIIKEPTTFVDPIIPEIPPSVSPSKTSKSALTNLTHEPTKHSAPELSGSALAETKIDKNEKDRKTATSEQAQSITKVSNVTVEEASLNEVEKQLKPTLEEENKLTEKVEVACVVKSSKQQKKPKTFIKEPTTFVDPIIPEIPPSVSPSKTSKSALTNLTHEPTKHSAPELFGSALAETKIDKNEKDQKTATSEQAQSIKKVSNAAVEEASLNEVEKQLKPTLEAENKLTEKVEVACVVKSSKQQKKPKTILIKEPTSFLDPIIPVIPPSVSPSKTSKSDLSNITHVTSKHSELELTSFPLVETKIDKNEKDQNTATIEIDGSNEEVSQKTTSSLNEVEKKVKSIPEEANKSTKTGTNDNADLNKPPKQNIEIKTLVKEPTPLEVTIAPVTSHSDSPSEIVQSALTLSSHEALEHSELELESKIVIKETESDKNEKEHKITKIEEAETIKQAEPIAKVFDDRIEANSTSKETNKSIKSASYNIIDPAKSGGTTLIPSRVEEEKSLGEVFNTTEEVAEKQFEPTAPKENESPKKVTYSIADQVKPDDTTAIPSEVLILNEEKADVGVVPIDIDSRETPKSDESVPTSDSSQPLEKDTKHLINLPQDPKPSAEVKTPTKKEDGLIRELDNSIINILSQLSNVNDNDPSSSIAEETTKQPKNDNQLNTKSVETFAKSKPPSIDGVQAAVNESVIRRRTSDVDGSELSFTNSLELERDYFYNPIDADNFTDQSRLPISIKSELQQPLSEIMFSGNRGQDDEDKLHMFNAYLAFEPVPTSSPNENDDNLNEFDELYSLLPTFALTNGPENVSGVNYESSEKTKTDIKKADFTPKEVDTLKATFEDDNISDVGKKQTIDVRKSEYEINDAPTISSPEAILMNPPQGITCSKTKSSKSHLIKLFQKNTPEKKVSTDETLESILESKLKSRQKPFWKLMKTPTKTKVFPENLEPRKLDSSTSLISLTDNPYTVDDVKSLPLYFDKIFEEKHTKTPSLSEKQVLPSLSSDVDDRFDRLKNEAPINKISKPILKDSSSAKDDEIPTVNSFDTKTHDDPKSQSISIVSTIPVISAQLGEQKVETNKSLPLDKNILDQSILYSNNSYPLEETTPASSKQLEKTPTILIEPIIDENSSRLKEPTEPNKSSSQINETKVDLQTNTLLKTRSEKPLIQFPIPAVENSPLEIKPTEKCKEEIFEKKTTSSNHLPSKTQPPVVVVSSMPSISKLSVIPSNLDPSSQTPTTLLLETKTPDPLEKSKTTQSTSENSILVTNKATLKQYSVCSDGKKENPSQLFCSEISLKSPTVAVVSSMHSISSTPVKPQTLEISGQNTVHKASSSCRKPLEQSFVAATPDSSKTISETLSVPAIKTAIAASQTLKRNSSLIDDTKNQQQPPSKIFCTEISAKSVPAKVTTVILNPKIPVKVISSKKPFKQIPVNKTPDICVKINKNTHFEESKPSLKRCPSLKEASNVQEPPSKILRPEVSAMSVTLQHHVSPTPNQISTPKIPYCNLTTSSLNVSKVNSPARSKTTTKPYSMPPKNFSIQNASPSSTSQRIIEPVLKQSVMLPSKCPKIPKTMTPVHTTEKAISVTSFKTGTPSRTPGTNNMEKPRSMSTPKSNNVYLSTPRPTSSTSGSSGTSGTSGTSSTSSTSGTSGSRTLNSLSSDLKRVTLDIEKIKNDLGLLPEIDKNYGVHKRRKLLLEELENKQRELNELKKKYQEYERYTRVLKAHSERKPIDKDHQPHQHNQQHRPNVQQSNDLKRKYDHSRPHSERQFSKFSASGHSAHVEQHKEPNHIYVNKFSELDKMSFANKNYQSAYINPEAKKLPPWDPKPTTADEIIRTLRRK